MERGEPCSEREWRDGVERPGVGARGGRRGLIDLGGDRQASHEGAIAEIDERNIRNTPLVDVVPPYAGGEGSANGAAGGVG